MPPGRDESRPYDEWRREMDGTTDLQGKQALGGTTLAASTKQPHPYRIATIALWVLGFVLLSVASVIVRFHPAP